MQKDSAEVAAGETRCNAIAQAAGEHRLAVVFEVFDTLQRTLGDQALGLVGNGVTVSAEPYSSDSKLLEALKDARARSKASVDDIWRFAKICRVANVMRPYLESVG